MPDTGLEPVLSTRDLPILLGVQNWLSNQTAAERVGFDRRHAS